ncbi:M20 family metallopeptidase [Shinella sp. CPCC 101442]|uniref:M20 family metallopeptidase n=1 Tax=Shinella sp. CPCC 101442 TaxID=2932265 RepID=UPI0021537AE4|nr:M20 family metallopeptidase [Shinella sp. CPCC 101442]MCR6502387.1 M20 family metallopeptidase [Shinella sp. CPCC 101442]
MSARHAEILQWISSRQNDMVCLLSTLVNVDSGSYDKEGVDAVGAHLSRFFAKHDLQTAVRPVEHFGDTLLVGTAAVRRGAGRHNILLMGHRDTVFGKGEAARRPFHIENGRAYGPGVADMKAGLVMNAFVLVAFQKFAPDVPLLVMLTGDEEIGSQASLAHIEEEARFARAVFNAEPARPTGNFVSGRKGGFTYRFEISGKAAHAGVNFTEGASAIGELAHKITALHALTDVQQGITLNVGLASGGSSSNTVAAKAAGEVDVRFVDGRQRDRLIADIEAILECSTVPGTTTVFGRQSESLPLAPTPENAALSDIYRQAAASLGVEVSGEFTGGCADSGIASSAGAPTVCATGPVGGKAHTEDEYILVETLSQRAAIVAASILRLPG